MPELPEVETVKKRLAEVIVGKTIVDLKVLRNKSFSGEIKQVLGRRVESVKRRAKLIYLSLANNLYLLIHLKMTGQLVYQDSEKRIGGGHPTADWVNQLPGKHTRIIFTLSNDANLFFNDLRVFGWIKVVSKKELQKELDKYGPDANSDQFNAQYLEDKLKNRTIPIKQAIMIGKIVGGVGNIYASEALFEAKIDPRRPAKELSSDEYRRLVRMIKKVICEGIKHGGTTFDGHYVNLDGLSGNYQEKLLVYGREGEACERCSGLIKKTKIGQRGTYFCTNCQK